MVHLIFHDRGRLTLIPPCHREATPRSIDQMLPPQVLWFQSVWPPNPYCEMPWNAGGRGQRVGWKLEGDVVIRRC